MAGRYALWRDGKKNMIFGLTDATYSHAVGIKVKDNCDKVLNHLYRIIGFGEVQKCYTYKADITLPPPMKMLLNTPLCTIKKLPDNVIEKLKEARNLVREEC